MPLPENIATPIHAAAAAAEFSPALQPPLWNEVPVDPTERSLDQLKPRQLYFAGFFALACTGNITPATLRDAVNRRFGDHALRHALNAAGGFDNFAEEIVGRAYLTWPQALLDGAEAWPRPPKRQPIPLPGFAANYEPSYNLPPSWGDTCRWYEEIYGLEHRLAEYMPPKAIADGAAPLCDWSEYWSTWVAPYDAAEFKKSRSILYERLIDLVGIPHINDLAGLEEALKNKREPYICFMPGENIRTGSELAGDVTNLCNTERAVLNLLILQQLRTGRGVSLERLARFSGAKENLVQQCLTWLHQKINKPKQPRAIVKVGRDHYQISASTILVDFRGQQANNLEEKIA